MSEKHRFLDPKTGEMIEVTWIARLLGGVACTVLLPMWLTCVFVGYLGLRGVLFDRLRILCPASPDFRVEHAIARWQHRRRRAKSNVSSHP